MVFQKDVVVKQFSDIHGTKIPGIGNIRRQYTCTICQAIFYKKDDIMDHKNSVHAY
jgi:5-methylcytosine-specific restriction endonuclease McrA